MARQPGSWVIVSRTSGDAIMETFSPRVAAAVNLASYEVVPILDWLHRINRKIKEAC